MKTCTRLTLLALSLGLAACSFDTRPDVALYNPDGTPIVPGQAPAPVESTDTPSVQSSFLIYEASLQQGGAFQTPLQDPSNGFTYYLRPKPIIGYNDLDNAVPVKDPHNHAAYALLTLNAHGAQQLLMATQNPDHQRVLVVMLQNQVISIIQITKTLSTQLRIPASSPYRAYQIVQHISDGD